MSGPSGFPLWGKALEEILEKLEGVDPAPIKAKLDAFEYSKAAQALWNHDADQVKNYIRNSSQDAKFLDLEFLAQSPSYKRSPKAA